MSKSSILLLNFNKPRLFHYLVSSIRAASDAWWAITNIAWSLKFVYAHFRSAILIPKRTKPCIQEKPDAPSQKNARLVSMVIFSSTTDLDLREALIHQLMVRLSSKIFLFKKLKVHRMPFHVPWFSTTCPKRSWPFKFQDRMSVYSFSDWIIPRRL